MSLLFIHKAYQHSLLCLQFKEKKNNRKQKLFFFFKKGNVLNTSMELNSRCDCYGRYHKVITTTLANWECGDRRCNQISLNLQGYKGVTVFTHP